MGGSASLDGNATCRVLDFGWASLMTNRFCWLLTRNTDRNKFQGMTIWALEPEEDVERGSGTLEMDKSLCHSIL